MAHASLSTYICSRPCRVYVPPCVVHAYCLTWQYGVGNGVADASTALPIEVHYWTAFYISQEKKNCRIIVSFYQGKYFAVAKDTTVFAHLSWIHGTLWSFFFCTVKWFCCYAHAIIVWLIYSLLSRYANVWQHCIITCRVHSFLAKCEIVPLRR